MKKQPKTVKAITAILQGLDASGKTSLLYRLKLGETVTTIPTIGFNVETFSHKDFSITLWDLGGGDKIKPLWRHYYPGKDAMIYVVNSLDSDRLPEAKDELKRLLELDEFAGKPFLILANKRDVPGAMNLQQIREGLDFPNCERVCMIECSAATGQGLVEAMDWLVGHAHHTVETVEEEKEHPEEKKEIAEVMRQRLETVKEVVKVLGVAGSALTEGVNKILEAPKGSKYEIAEDGKVTVIPPK